jgi:hypothetical protein
MMQSIVIEGLCAENVGFLFSLNVFDCISGKYYAEHHSMKSFKTLLIQSRTKLSADGKI